MECHCHNHRIFTDYSRVSDYPDIAAGKGKVKLGSNIRDVILYTLLGVIQKIWLEKIMDRLYFRQIILFFIILPSLLFSQSITKYQQWQEQSRFRGFCISAWNNVEERVVSPQDFINLKNTGATLAIIQTEGFRESIPPYNQTIWWADTQDTIFYSQITDSMISYARAANLSYVLSVRSGPGRIDVAEENEKNLSTLWSNENEQNLYSSMLKEMTARYLSDSLFKGIDPILEPDPHPELAGEHYSILGTAMQNDNIKMDQIYAQIIDSLRTVAPCLPVMIEGVHWSNPDYFPLMEKPVDDLIILKVHCYNPYDFSHAESPFSAHYPDNYWNSKLDSYHRYNKEFLSDTLYLPVKELSQEGQIPVLIGEFGLRFPQDGGKQYLTDIANIAKESGWHFAIWNFNNGSDFYYQRFGTDFGEDYWDTILDLMKPASSQVISNSDPPNPFQLLGNFPNPFNAQTQISFYLSKDERVKIQILNIQGHNLEIFLNKRLSAGHYSVRFNGTHYASGVYFYCLSTADYTVVRKMILLK